MNKEINHIVSRFIKNKALLYSLPLFPILAYVTIAFLKINYPGSMYDESLHLNAARGMVDSTTFITKTFHGIPVLLMPYIGALKAYIFYPIFKIFGVSALTMRLPNILISSFAIYILYRALIKQIGIFKGMAVISLVSLSASFIVFTRLDNGPVVLEFLLKILSLFFILKYFEKFSIKYLFLFWVVMFLGVFNKLNFIWYVNASVLAILVIYFKDIYLNHKKDKLIKISALSILSYLLIFGYFLYINKFYHLTSSLGFVGWSRVKSLLIGVVDGSWNYQYIYSNASISSSIYFYIIGLFILIGIPVGINNIFKRKELITSRFLLFSDLILSVLVTEIMFTKQATAGWHYFSIYPLIQISFIISIFLILKLVFENNKKILYVVFSLLVICMCTYQLNVYSKYLKLVGHEPINPIWSPGIFSLINYTKAQKSAQFVSLDWGTHNQLIGFDPIKNKYYEFIDGSTDNNQSVNNSLYRRNVAELSNPYYISFVPKNEINIPSYRVKFVDLISVHKKSLEIVKTIYYDNSPIYNVYIIKP